MRRDEAGAWLTMPETEVRWSWLTMTPSVVKCPANTCCICSTVQLVSVSVYQLSAYQPIMNQTYFGPYNFCLYACNAQLKLFYSAPVDFIIHGAAETWWVTDGFDSDFYTRQSSSLLSVIEAEGRGYST